MTPKSAQESERGSKNGTQTPWKPPRGIHFFERSDRPTPFVMQWRDGARRRKQAFAKAEDREEAAKELAAKREEHGREILNFDPREWRRWLEFKAVVGEVDPLLVAQEWKQAKKGLQADPLTVAEAVTRYMALRSQEKLADETMRHVKKHLQDRFAAQFGSMALQEVTPDQIRGWLAGLVNERTGAPAENLTRRHHRKDLNTFLKQAVREGWIRTNPCEVVKPPPIEAEDVAVIPVEDVRRLFEANRDQPVIGRLALEAFGGLRYSSAARIQKEHIDLKAKGIAMPGMLHKSGKRKYRQGQPANLWAWLKHAPESCWTMTVRQYLKAKGEAFIRAGVSFPRNGLRHSFASYHLALHKNPPLTAYLMQHTNTATTEIYEGVAKEKDARAYFAIVH